MKLARKQYSLAGENTTLIAQSLHDIRTSDDSPDEIPPDVLIGFSGHVAYIANCYPDQLPHYRQRAAEMVEQLRIMGRDYEARRFAAFEALLSVAGAAR